MATATDTRVDVDVDLSAEVVCSGDNCELPAVALMANQPCGHGGPICDPCTEAVATYFLVERANGFNHYCTICGAHVDSLAPRPI